MSKRYMPLLLLVFACIFSGCSCSKEELINNSSSLIEENEELINKIEQYNGVENLFSFYNKITTESVNSFVLVESKTLTSKTLYSNGVVVASNGYYYYVLTDYYAIKQTGIVSYKVSDSNAVVYNANIASDYDKESGLVLLQVNTSSHTNIAMKSISLAQKSELVAYLSSINQANKVQLSDKLKTSTITYNNTSYNCYYLEEINFDSGSILLNTNNELCGLYLSKIGKFIDSELIKAIAYSIYSLVL